MEATVFNHISNNEAGSCQNREISAIGQTLNFDVPVIFWSAAA
jgi:hypothetical protein